MPSTYQSIVINAPVEDVWNKVKNFHDFSWAADIINSCDAVGSKGPAEVGAKRLLNGVFHETLSRMDDEQHLLEYSIDDGPSPVSATEVSNYIGRLKLHPVTLGNATFVEWSSSWQSQQQDAVEFCHGIYVALLQALARGFDQ